ncbi:MAG: DUF1801 domain-containing protein [Pseudomonadota bacterium]
MSKTQEEVTPQAQIDALRHLVMKTASGLKPPVTLVEELKWGQPSLRPVPKAGTPLRLGHTKSGELALFVHCATSLIANWAEACALRGQPARIEGTRALIIDPDDMAVAAPFIRQALTYYR